MPKVRSRQRLSWALVAAVVAVPARGDPAVADECEEDAASEATLESGATAFGDSVHSDDDADAAVAAAGPDAPRETAHRRDAKPPRDTAPNADAGDAPAWCAQRNDAEHVGNVGWLFGNLGKRPKHAGCGSTWTRR